MFQTVVLTTTLNGRSSTLEMETGNKGLTTCLDNADAFIPKPPEEYEDVSEFFASQQVVYFYLGVNQLKITNQTQAVLALF